MKYSHITLPKCVPEQFREMRPGDVLIVHANGRPGGEVRECMRRIAGLYREDVEKLEEMPLNPTRSYEVSYLPRHLKSESKLTVSELFLAEISDLAIPGYNGLHVDFRELLREMDFEWLNLHFQPHANILEMPLLKRQLRDLTPIELKQISIVRCLASALKSHLVPCDNYKLLVLDVPEDYEDGYKCPINEQLIDFVKTHKMMMVISTSENVDKTGPVRYEKR